MKKYKHKIEILTNENDISYYLLGAFMTDGCIVIRNNTPIRAVLSNTEYEWINNIKQIISPDIPIIKLQGEGGKEYYSLQIYSKEICRWFMKHGCLPQKSLSLIFPQVPEQYLPDFIRGCIDGDGSLGIYQYKKIWKGKSYTCSSKHCYLCSSSKNFIKGFEEYLKNNNFSYSYTERNPTTSKLKSGRIIKSSSKQYKISIYSNKDLNRLLSTIYYPGHKISMKRKRDLSEKIIMQTEKYLTRDTSFSEKRKRNISNALLKRSKSL